MTRGTVAKKVRLEREAHPERFCARKDCLWRLNGVPCPKHGQIRQQRPVHERPRPKVVEPASRRRVLPSMQCGAEAEAEIEEGEGEV